MKFDAKLAYRSIFIYSKAIFINQQNQICQPELTSVTTVIRKVTSPENANKKDKKDQKETTTEVIHQFIQKPEGPEDPEMVKMPPSAITVKAPDIWPDNAQPKDKKDLKEPINPEATTLQSVITANNLDIWPENAPRNQGPESKEINPKEIVTTAKRLDTSQETAQKAVTERKPLSVTNVTKMVISQEIAKVILKIIFRLIQ